MRLESLRMDFRHGWVQHLTQGPWGSFSVVDPKGLPWVTQLPYSAWAS